MSRPVDHMERHSGGGVVIILREAGRTSCLGPSDFGAPSDFGVSSDFGVPTNFGEPIDFLALRAVANRHCESQEFNL